MPSLYLFRSLISLNAALFVIALTGCLPSAQPPAANKGGTAEHGHDHAHEELGPHKGHLIELGEEEYHAELVHTEKDHKVTVYLLDKAAKAAVTSTAKEIQLNLVIDKKPTQYVLSAESGSEGTEGASQYSVVDEKLCDALHGDVQGRLNVTIGEKEFVGEVDLHAHDHKH